MSNYSRYIWFNGTLTKFEDAKIHVLSHCIHYGSAVFEGIKCYDTNKGPAVFKLEEHINRLHKSANAFKIQIPFDVQTLCDATKDLIKKNEVKNCYLRPIAYYGFDTLGVHPKNCPVEVAIATLNWGAYVSKEALKEGAKITKSPWKKYKSNGKMDRTKPVSNELFVIYISKTGKKTYIERLYKLVRFAYSELASSSLYFGKPKEKRTVECLKKMILKDAAVQIYKKSQNIYFVFVQIFEKNAMFLLPQSFFSRTT